MKPLKVVIIDDEEAHFRLMKRAISKEFPLASVDYFEDAKSCLERLHEISPDVIILDYLMPVMNGIEFLAALKREGSDIIPVIMITGQGDESIAVQAMKLGAWDYLVKSPNFFDLLPSIIEKVVRERKLKETLRESEERYRASFDNSVDAINIFSEDRRFLDVNKKLIQFSGYSKEEILSMKLEDLYPESVKPATKERIQKMLQGEEVSVFETYLLTKKQEKIPVEVGVTALKDCYGQKIVFQGNIRDITERKRAQEHVHTLSQQLMKAQENERQRLSRDLHDLVGQDLSALKIGLDTLFDDQAEVPPGKRQRVAELSKTVQGTIISVRDLAYGLRPTSLDQFGFAKTILRYCEEFSARTGVKVDFFAAGLDDLKFDSDTEITLYRLIQEGFNNVKKHADATEVTIRLVASFPDIILRIEDNGKGFDIQNRLVSAVDEKRMGLRSMEERVALLGGKMSIESRVMQGTKILIEIPIKGKKSGQ
ncbi:MAG: PAS domain S-box protein [Deltaproteobacteria bacterium]|nr:PAS domain S-box protein [Deltaproteobacteria bacterium]MBW1793606.1 PAS domain S-box protein [Deltaproteobacteria bacterium]MBW2329986.1 PAS domain S-box protein [Deltaproteobacteria bacterium]